MDDDNADMADAAVVSKAAAVAVNPFKSSSSSSSKFDKTSKSGKPSKTAALVDDHDDDDGDDDDRGKKFKTKDGHKKSGKGGDVAEEEDSALFVIDKTPHSAKPVAIAVTTESVEAKPSKKPKRK